MENNLLSKTFMWMALGLFVTFLTGFFVANSDAMLRFFYEGATYWIFAIVEIVLVIVLSALIMKMSPMVAKLCFLLYSFVSGVTFASIFVFYNMGSIIAIFLVSALIFLIMALVGYKTKANLTSMGTYLIFGLIAAIIVSLLNILIFKSTMLELIISVICVLIFMGITAYDVQKIKALENSGLPEDNLAIYGALDLYLDFINLFLHLLSIFGKSDN